MLCMRPLLLLLLIAIDGRSIAQEEVPPVKLFEPYDRDATTAALDTPTIDTVRPPQAGEITVIADPRIDRLMEMHAEHEHQRPGFRVQIFLGDRRTAEETKRGFEEKNPGIPAYISWLAPNFRLRVGDLATRLEAEKLLHDLRRDHPGSYIVPDQIELHRDPEGK